MKKIMLIILISFAFGQTAIDITADKPTKGFDLSVLNLSTRIITVKDTNDYELWKRMFDEKGLIQVTIYEVDTYFPTTLSYELYAEECYNDSTMDYIHLNRNSRFPCVVNFWNECQVKGHRDSTVYNHPKPTFEGFIEWSKTGE